MSGQVFACHVCKDRGYIYIQHPGDSLDGERCPADCDAAVLDDVLVGAA